MYLLKSIFHSFIWYIQTLFYSCFLDPIYLFVTILIVVFFYIVLKNKEIKFTPKLTIYILTLYGVYIAYFFTLNVNPFFEGDAGNIIAGTAQIIKEVPDPILYNYSTQPFSFSFLALLGRIAPIDLAFLSTLFSQISMLTILYLCYAITKKTKIACIRSCFYRN